MKRVQRYKLFISGLLLASTQVALAATVCAVQRSQYPQNWADTSKEANLYVCSGSNGLRFRIKISDQLNNQHERLVSLVHQLRSNVKAPNGASQETFSDSTRAEDVLRTWLDPEQLLRLHDGQYFSTIFRSEQSCFRGGDLFASAIFRLDVPPPNLEINQSQRYSTYQAERVQCERL